MGDRSFLIRLAAVVGSLGLSACGVSSPSDQPTPPPCTPAQYLNKDFPDVAVVRDLIFSEVADNFGVHVLRMDVYQPVGDTSTRRPAIVWMFGGNFNTGDKSQLGFYATEFALRGYVTAAIDYRKLRQYERVSEAQAQDAAQSDTQAAIRYLRSRAADFGLDAARIAAAGFSAGSITAFNAGYRSEFVGDNTDNLGFAQNVQAVMGLDGFSTSAGIQANDPPFILFRSTVVDDDPRDPNVLPDLIAQADSARIPYEISEVEGANHLGLIAHPYDQTIVARAAPFLRAQFACR